MGDLKPIIIQFRDVRTCTLSEEVEIIVEFELDCLDSALGYLVALASFFALAFALCSSY